MCEVFLVMFGVCVCVELMCVVGVVLCVLMILN